MMNMMKRWIGMLLVVALCALLLPAMGEAAELQPVLGGEIAALAEEIRALALASHLLNDPASEDAASEDGTAFLYAFGTLYADGTELKEDTALNAVVLTDGDHDLPVLRGTGLDSTLDDLLSRLPCENPELLGTYTGAVLYLTGDEDAWQYGRVLRDGQRVSAVEYGETDRKAGTRTTITYQISGGAVISVLLGGLNSTEDPETDAELYDELSALQKEAEYARVPVSYNGAELNMFEEADLFFPALSYLTVEPYYFGDQVEDLLMDNEDGTFLRRIDGDGFEAVFSCDARGENALLISYTILTDALEGPRCVRLGDYFQDDFNRFRHGEGAYDEASGTEVLYGTPGEAPYGLAEYGAKEIVLRYAARTLDGRSVELYLHYTDTVLDEIILHTL